MAHFKLYSPYIFIHSPNFEPWTSFYAHRAALLPGNQSFNTTHSCFQGFYFAKRFTPLPALSLRSRRQLDMKEASWIRSVRYYLPRLSALIGGTLWLKSAKSVEMNEMNDCLWLKQNWMRLIAVILAVTMETESEPEAAFSINEEEMKKWMSRAFEMVSFCHLKVKIMLI